MSMSLKKKIRDLIADDSTQATEIEALKDAIGDESTQGSILYRLKELEDK